jgi:hypothetical protein
MAQESNNVSTFRVAVSFPRLTASAAKEGTFFPDWVPLRNSSTSQKHYKVHNSWQ